MSSSSTQEYILEDEEISLGSDEEDLLGVASNNNSLSTSPSGSLSASPPTSAPIISVTADNLATKQGKLEIKDSKKVFLLDPKSGAHVG